MFGVCGGGPLKRHIAHYGISTDHFDPRPINGVGDDNRIENLQIVCPNCAATLDTHCGRQNRIHVLPKRCEYCGAEFVPKYWSQRYCSQICGVHSPGPREPQPERRKVERPPYEQLLEETRTLGFSAVGRQYGVSDNAVRKWIRWYEARLDAEGVQESAA